MESAITKPATPGIKQAVLEPFVGLWNTTGQIKGNSGEPDIPINGTDVYEWLPGGFFLLHRVDVHMGEERAQSIEIIGFDPAVDLYTMFSFDHQGNAGRMQARLQDGIWTFEGPTMRFTGHFNDKGNTLSGIWEQSADGKNWQHWMDITLTRAE